MIKSGSKPKQAILIWAPKDRKNRANRQRPQFNVAYTRRVAGQEHLPNVYEIN
jgi:hypothetical protein